MDGEKERKTNRWMIVAIALAAALIALAFLYAEKSAKLGEAEANSLIAKNRIETLEAEIQEQSENPLLYFASEEQPYQQIYEYFYAPAHGLPTEIRDNTVYLTFDDGPSDNTDLVLDTLAKYDVKATFFVCGFDTGEKGLARLQRMIDEGHTVGMHSYTHDYKQVYSSPENFLTDFAMIYNWIHDNTGYEPSVFRFPGGSINSYNYGNYQELIAEMLRRGFVPYDWNVSSGDASAKSLQPEQITANVVYGCSQANRSIVLMHDGRGHSATAESLDATIAQLKAAGYDFAALTPEDKPVLFGYKDNFGQ